MEYQTPERWKLVKALLEKKQSQEGVVIGYHGTSAIRARKIADEGFKDNICEEGDEGVYFWDEEFKQNANGHGKLRARDDGDLEFAIIRGSLRYAQPDLRHYRPQWIVRACNIEILDIECFQIPSGNK